MYRGWREQRNTIWRGKVTPQSSMKDPFSEGHEYPGEESALSCEGEALQKCVLGRNHRGQHSLGEHPQAGLNFSHALQVRSRPKARRNQQPECSVLLKRISLISNHNCAESPGVSQRGTDRTSQPCEGTTPKQTLNETALNEQRDLGSHKDSGQYTQSCPDG